MKLMKKYFYIAVAAIAVLSGCAKDEYFDVEQPSSDGQCFTASIEQEPDTRTTLNGMTVKWASGDQISINGKIYKASPKTDATKAIFTPTSSEAVASAGKFKAYYPSALYNSGKPSLQSQQTYSAGAFSNIPMYAESSSRSLKFNNICGVLAIKVTNEDIASLKSIKVSSGNHDMSGLFKITGNAAVLTSDKGGSNTVKLVSSKALSLTKSGTVFYVAVPAQTYRELKIELSSDGSTYSKVMTTKSGKDITVARNTIYSIDFQDENTPVEVGKGTTTATIDGKQVKVPWVQLWKNGPKWAVYNVGVTDGIDAAYCGSVFAWGATSPGGGNSNSNEDIQDTSYDTAKAMWGSNWMMPQKLDFDMLINSSVTDGGHWVTNYKGSGTSGYLIKGKGDYAENELFFPSKSSSVNGCDFWCSEPDSNKAWELMISQAYGKRVDPSYKSVEYAVRAIVNEHPPLKGTAKANINGKKVDVNWVVVDGGGAKWAEYNVGATSASEYGGHYGWGQSEDHNYDPCEAKYDIQGTSFDTAKKIWGDNWQMPTTLDFSCLFMFCDRTWTSDYNGTGLSGMVFSGRNKYSGNSVFFPAAGYEYGQLEDAGTKGYYWGGAYSPDYYAVYLFVNVSQSFSSNTYYYKGAFSVRAIVAD